MFWKTAIDQMIEIAIIWWYVTDKKCEINIIDVKNKIHLITKIDFYENFLSKNLSNENRKITVSFGINAFDSKRNMNQEFHLMFLNENFINSFFSILWKSLFTKQDFVNRLIFWGFKNDKEINKFLMDNFVSKINWRIYDLKYKNFIK
jgi:hypothetical protein